MHVQVGIGGKSKQQRVIFEASKDLCRRYMRSTSGFENDTRHGHSYNGRQIVTLCDLSNGAISNDLD